jgi:hypothetical protein
MQLQMSETSGGYNNVPYKQWWPELLLIASDPPKGDRGPGPMMPLAGGIKGL